MSMKEVLLHVVPVILADNYPAIAAIFPHGDFLAACAGWVSPSIPPFSRIQMLPSISSLFVSGAYSPSLHPGVLPAKVTWYFVARLGTKIGSGNLRREKKGDVPCAFSRCPQFFCSLLSCPPRNAAEPRYHPWRQCRGYPASAHAKREFHNRHQEQFRLFGLSV